MKKRFRSVSDPFDGAVRLDSPNSNFTYSSRMEIAAKLHGTGATEDAIRLAEDAVLRFSRAETRSEARMDFARSLRHVFAMSEDLFREGLVPLLPHGGEVQENPDCCSKRGRDGQVVRFTEAEIHYLRAFRPLLDQPERFDQLVQDADLRERVQGVGRHHAVGLAAPITPPVQTTRPWISEVYERWKGFRTLSRRQFVNIVETDYSLDDLERLLFLLRLAFRSRPELGEAALGIVEARMWSASQQKQSAALWEAYFSFMQQLAHTKGLEYALRFLERLETTESLDTQTPVLGRKRALFEENLIGRWAKYDFSAAMKHIETHSDRKFRHGAYWKIIAW